MLLKLLRRATFNAAVHPGPLSRQCFTGAARKLSMQTADACVAKPDKRDRLLPLTVSNLRAPSPLAANGDEDSEAESYRDGRCEEVDRDTRSRAFAWCRDFLAGSWKTIHEPDFHISIVR